MQILPRSFCVILLLLDLIGCGAAGYSQDNHSDGFPEALEDLSAMVHVGRITKNPDLLCRAESSADTCISIADAYPRYHERIEECKSIKRRLAKLCLSSSFGETERRECIAIEAAVERLASGNSSRRDNLAAPAGGDEQTAHSAAAYQKQTEIGPSVLLTLLGIIIGSLATLFVRLRNEKKSTSLRETIPQPELVPFRKLASDSQRDRNHAPVIRPNLNQSLSMIDEILPLASASRDLTYFDNVPIGLMSVVETGEIRSTNSRLAAMVGKTTAALFGVPVAEILRVGDDSSREQSFLELKAVLQISPTEGWLRNCDHDWIPVDVSGAEFQSGSKKGTLLSVTDRTARQEMEELRRNFVSMVSHDLATPLGSLALFFDIIRHSAAYESQDYKLAVETAEGETNRLIKLVTDLLDVSKLESGKFDLELEEADATVLARNAVNSVRQLAESAQLEIAIRCAETKLLVDEGRMTQVLVNLLSNAIKFSPSGGTITVEGRSLDDGFEFAVSDQGPGIPQEHRTRIFDRFAQVSASDKKTGTGLGLAICKLIVEQHGGAITVDSAANGGARFICTLSKSRI